MQDLFCWVLVGALLGACGSSDPEGLARERLRANEFVDIRLEKVGGQPARYRFAAKKRHRQCTGSLTVAGDVVHGSVYEANCEVSNVAADQVAACLQHRDPASCSHAGDSYREGRGVSRDLRRAADLYRRGCDGNRAAACAGLSALLRRGDGVARDPTRGFALLEKACRLDRLPSCAEVGRALVLGEGTPANPARGAQVLESACDRGEQSACAILGFLLHSGTGVPRDEARGIQLSEAACTARVALACANLGSFVSRTNPSRALTLYRQACDAGDGLGCRNLAVSHRDGMATPVDHAEADRFMRRACELGDEPACQIDCL